MTNTVLNLPQSDIERLERLYDFGDRESGEVWQFIENHPFLTDLLLEVPEKVIQFFPDASLSLKVIIEPESPSEEDDMLGIAIASEMDAEESVDRLEQFDYDWWLEASMRSHDKLLIDVES